MKTLIILIFSLFNLNLPTSVATPTPSPTIVPTPTLPPYHLIKTAFIPQAPEKNWNQPWQDACEEAALFTVDNYYRHQSPDIPQMLIQFQRLFDYEKSQNWSHDINTSQMSQIAQDYFHYHSQIIENPSINQIKQYLSQNIPVIVPAAGKILFKENKYFKSGGPYYHNLVILGYDDPQQQFIVHDVGTQHGVYFHYSYSVLMESIHDFPSSGDKENILNGAKRVIILLQ